MQSDLMQYFIAGAVGYYECSSVNSTGIHDILQAIGFHGITSKPRKNWPLKKYVIKFNNQ